jgi:hypothetical protein
MTDEIDPEAEALARARFKSGLPSCPATSTTRLTATMRGTVADRPVVELILALVDDDGRVDGRP